MDRCDWYMDLLKTELDNRDAVIFILKVIDEVSAVYTIIPEEDRSEKMPSDKNWEHQKGIIENCLEGMFMNKNIEKWDYRAEEGLLFWEILCWYIQRWKKKTLKVQKQMVSLMICNPRKVKLDSLWAGVQVEKWVLERKRLWTLFLVAWDFYSSRFTMTPNTFH